LNGESLQPCSLKIGPKRKGSQEIETPALVAKPSIRAAERYEYVLPNSNQNSSPDMVTRASAKLDKADRKAVGHGGTRLLVLPDHATFS
jgi:hypothetical protein